MVARSMLAAAGRRVRRLSAWCLVGASLCDGLLADATELL